uniref:Uncharacterized protein n=1 Tax=Caenorhabditis tropicalis TaxID=1561998 RepID=A0A1I7TV92_9PELO
MIVVYDILEQTVLKTSIQPIHFNVFRTSVLSLRIPTLFFPFLNVRLYRNRCQFASASNRFGNNDGS